MQLLQFPWKRGRKLMPVFCQRVFLGILVGVGMITCLGVFVGISLAQRAHTPSFSIEPTFGGPAETGSNGYFIYASIPGSRIDDSIHVINTGSIRDVINLYGVDVTTGQMGGTAVRSYSDPKRDVGAWITLNQAQVTLDPGQSQDVSFTVTIPTHVRPGQHGGAIVAEDAPYGDHLQPRQHTSAPRIDIQSIVALGVLINLPGPFVERLNASRVWYDEKSTHQRFLLALENTGTQLLHPEGSLQLRTAEGKLLQTVPMALHTFIPQTSISYPIDIHHKALVAGKRYTVQLQLSYEHHHRLSYTSTFLVPLPSEEPFINQIQDLVSSPPEHLLSTLTPWHYVLGLILLVLMVSPLLFWGRKCRSIITKIIISFRLKKRKHVKPAPEDERVPVYAKSKEKRNEK